jgi:hypothetical protein
MCAVPARANIFTATELSNADALLSQFNLVTLSTGSSSYFSNVSTSNASPVIGGRTIVGGNAYFGNDHVCNNGSGVCVGNATKAIDSTGQLFGAVTVFGNVYSFATMGQQNGGGDVSIKGDTTGFISGGNGKFNFGGQTSGLTLDTNSTTVNVTTAATGGTIYNANGGTSGPTPAKPNVLPLTTVFPFSLSGITSEAKDLYSGLANLPGTPGVKADALPANYSGAFTSGVDYTAAGSCTVGGKTGQACNYGVVTSTLSQFEAEGSGFTGVKNNASNAATFVIITGSGGTLPTITNADPNVIYDFVSASSLTVSSAFDGTILAPLASLTQSGSGGTINGSVIVASITQNADLYNGNAFTGDLSGLTNFTYNARVPEPASIALFSSGLAGVAWLRRKRKK